MVYRSILTLCFFCFALNSAKAQFRDSSVRKTVTLDTAAFVMKKSPGLALLLSGVLPGAGQIYTGGWYKAPFILGGIALCFYGASVQNTRYQYTSDSVSNQLARGDALSAARYTSAREFYRDDRDKFYIYSGLVYIANLLDAYISAHLFDFDVSDPATTAFLAPPQTSQDSWRLALYLRF